MTRETAVPQHIYALWMQGEDHAPPLVKMCLRRWRRLNPDYKLVVLDRKDVEEVLHEFPVRISDLPAQALSDVVRIKLMSDRGGVWVDATVFPIRPLKVWLPEAANSGFFAFEGYRKPLAVDSWFLAARPGHLIPSLWWDLVEKYWRKPRKLLDLHGDNWLFNYNFDPLSFFGSAEFHERDSYPYYWFMYMFSHLLHTSNDFSVAWAQVDRRPGSACHLLHNLCDEDPHILDSDLVSASSVTNVQKLSYKDAHARRWLTLDEAFAGLDRQTLDENSGADLEAYPVFKARTRDVAPGWRSDASHWLRAKGGQLKHQFMSSPPGRWLADH